MTTPDRQDQTIPARRGRRAVRITLISITLAAILLLAVSTMLSSR